MEQMQIEEPERHSYDDDGRRKKKIIIIIAVLVLVLAIGILISLIKLLSSDSGYYDAKSRDELVPPDPEQEAEKKQLRLDLVLPGSRDWIPPSTAPEDPDDKQYIDELTDAYPYLSKSCGLTDRRVKKDQEDTQEGRILYLNQEAAKPGRVPWQLELFLEDRTTRNMSPNPYCGATLVSAHYGLTAAHCLPRYGDLDLVSHNLIAIAGYVLLDQLRNANKRHLVRYISQAWTHYDWRGTTLGEAGGRVAAENDRPGDVGVIRWREPFQRVHTRDGIVVISPVCLPNPRLVAKYNLTYPGKHWISGMGSTGPDPTDKFRNDRLRLAAMEYPVDKLVYDECSRRKFSSDPTEPYDERHIVLCRNTTARIEPSICSGDSGGPLTSTVLDPGPSKRRHFLTGIASFVNHNTNDPSRTCADIEKVGFVRVEPYMEWIDYTIRQFDDWQDIY